MKLFNYWRSSASYRVRLALEFKGLKYEYVAVNLARGEQHEGPHRGRNPWGGVPVLEVEEGGKTVQLPQSVAIVEYLEEQYPQKPLFPKGALERARMRAMVELVNSGIQPLHNLQVLNKVKELAPGGDTKPWAELWIGKGLDALEAMASEQAKDTAGTFLVGNSFTFADACLLPQLFGARRFASVDPARYPTLVRVETECLKLDFVQKARPENQPDATN